jgi:hypothetical protein
MDGHRSNAMKDTAIDREIQDLLAIDPAPEFTARVRARIEDEAESKPWFTWSRVAVAAGSVAALAVAAVMSVPSTQTPPSAIAPAMAQTQTAIPAVTPQPIARGEQPPSTATAVARVKHAAITRIARHRDPEVIMPTEELRGMRRLLAMANQGDQAVVALLTVPNSSAETPLGTPPPIVIQPLTIEPLNPDTF